MKINLRKKYFSKKQNLLLEFGKLKAYLFKYDSGVEAIKLENELGYIVVLPYLGQVIWDAIFYNRSLKMQTSFTEPTPTNIFGHTYGCYLMHCGMTSMGVPKESDHHPIHGDLPFADMKESWIEFEKDDKGAHLQIKSLYERNIAFDEHYIAIPSVKLYESSSILEVHIHAQNLSRLKMNLMYLCHINNKIIPNAKIHQTMDWDKQHMGIQALPANPSPELSSLYAKVKENPALSNPIIEGNYYDPEICFFLREMKKDEHNYSHFLHLLPNGEADYTYFNSTILEHGVRWIAYHENCRSMGMVLPGTAESEGFTAELKKNNMCYLEPGQTFDATIFCGALTAKEAKEIQRKIEKINKA